VLILPAERKRIYGLLAKQWADRIKLKAESIFWTRNERLYYQHATQNGSQAGQRDDHSDAWNRTDCAFTSARWGA
jgi:hypothetical protein